MVNALEETDPEDGGWALSMAAIRAGETPLAITAVDAILDHGEVDDSLDGRIQLARCLGIMLARHAPLEPRVESRILEYVESVYPNGNFQADRHLVEILVALNSEMVVRATIPLIEDATTQEESLHHLHALRLQKRGWDSATSRRAVMALITAQHYSGGASLRGFIDATTEGVLGRLGPEFREQFKTVVADQRVAVAQSGVRPFVKNWTVEDIEPHLSRTYAYRNFERGRQIFEETQCVHCHQFGNIGAGYGPNLSEVGARFSPRDLLITMIDPERDLSDQYAGLAVTLDDGTTVVGMPVSETQEQVVLVADPRASLSRIEIPMERIRSRRETSVMPAGLLNSCTMDEVLDLLAYLSTAGNSDDPAFRSPP